MQYTPKLPEDNHNVTDSSPAKDFAILLSGLMGIIIVAYMALGFTVDWAVEKMDPRTEIKVFNSFSFDLGMEEEHDVRKSAILQRMVDELNRDCTRLPVKFKVYAIPDKMVNAMALPGGTILVFGGLLDIMDSENALMMVLGHELGHFKNRDHLKGMGRGLVLMVLSSMLMGPDNMLNDWMSTSLTLSQLAYGRGQESEADAFGLKAIQCRYGHVSGATQFFETMSKKHHVGNVQKFFVSHPVSEERVANLKSLATQQGFGEGKLTPLREELKTEKLMED